jgi:hypothetical protein
VKDAGFDQRKACLRHLKRLSVVSIFNVKQSFVRFAMPSNALLPLAAFNASDAVGVQSKAEFFVPILLFFREEDEWPLAVSTFTREVKVMRDRTGGRRLSLEIGNNGSVGNSPWPGRTIFIEVVAQDVGDVATRRFDFRVSGRIPVKVHTITERLRIQAGDTGFATIARMINERVVIIFVCINTRLGHVEILHGIEHRHPWTCLNLHRSHTTAALALRFSANAAISHATGSMVSAGTTFALS